MPEPTKSPIEAIHTQTRVAAIVLLVGFVGLGIAFVYRQVIKGPEMHVMALKKRQSVEALAATRGSILDRNGKPLAEDAMSAMVIADPTLIQDLPMTAAKLGSVLGRPANELETLLTRRKTVAENGKEIDVRFVVLAQDLSPQKVKLCADLKFPGVFVRQRFRRHYPGGALASQVLGTLNDTGVGVTGIECSQNLTLAGIPGRLVAERDRAGRVILESIVHRTEPIGGRPVELTIDIELQKTVEDALTRACAKHYALGGMAIALVPQTGEIAAMASVPTIDANLRHAKRAKALVQHATAELNRNISGIYEPGSIWKLLTIAFGLETGAITSRSQFYCNGRENFGAQRSIKCDHGAHGSCAPGDAMERSCNITCAKIALRIGPDRFAQTLRQMGALDRSWIGLYGERMGMLTSIENLRRSRHTLATLGFGHSVAVTPLSLAAAYATIANDGVWVQPHLLRRANDGQPFVPTKRTVFKPEVARQVRDMLIRVVHGEKGTGKAARLPGYLLGGKTGTAQKAGRGGYNHSDFVASFIGLIPADKPQLVVLVMVDRPRGQTYGGTVAAPVFQEIARYVVHAWRIPQSEAIALATVSGQVR